jgi:hypothetical protein
MAFSDERKTYSYQVAKRSRGDGAARLSDVAAFSIVDELVDDLVGVAEVEGGRRLCGGRATRPAS